MAKQQPQPVRRDAAGKPEGWLTSPKPLRQPGPDEPPMSAAIRIPAYIDEPTDENAKYLRELLERCGDLVWDGMQYRLSDKSRHGIIAVPVELLGVAREALARGIDKMQLAEASQLGLIG